MTTRRRSTATAPGPKETPAEAATLTATATTDGDPQRVERQLALFPVAAADGGRPRPVRAAAIAAHDRPGRRGSRVPGRASRGDAAAPLTRGGPDEHFATPGDATAR